MLISPALSFWSGFFLLFRIFFFFLSFCEEWDGNFDWDCTESVNNFWQDSHFHNTNSVNPWTWQWYVFPFSSIFLCLFLQRFKVFIVEVVYFLIKFIPRYFVFLEPIVNERVSVISSSVCLEVEGHVCWGATVSGRWMRMATSGELRGVHGRIRQSHPARPWLRMFRFWLDLGMTFIIFDINK